MAEVAAVGWVMSALGWIVSPATTRLLNDGFALLGFDEPEKLRDLEARLLPQLALILERADKIPPGPQRARIELWAGRLRAAFYDAEDILDLADYHRLREQVLCQSGNKSALDRAKHIFSGKTRKLKKVLKKLEKLIEQGSQFVAPLTSTISSGNGTSNPSNDVSGIVTTSTVVPRIIFGRDRERDDITRLLHETAGDFEPSSSDSKCYSVIGVYGIAGSGKTTLAQYVCTYERMSTYFSPIIWVHVSQNFSVAKIYQEMLEAASSGESSREFSNLDTLQMKLEEQLRCKRFFLVLDDVWAANDANVQYKLNQLLSPLKVGKKGSMVLVTTRFKGACISLGAQSPMRMPDLNETDFFNLFMYYAIHDINLDAQELDMFQMIGKQIVKKLKRSPLAGRVIGARLRQDLRPTFWRRFADQDVLPDTIGALWWSYQQLGEQVRRCFAYCSMFPQGYMFSRDELVDLWIAEGFIKATNLNEQEIVGQNYFNELVSCSFLETKNYVYRRKDEWFTMHDLLHELAMKVAGNDCLRIKGGEMKEFPPDVRHLFICTKDQMKITEQICKLEKLRTLIVITSIGGVGITVEELEGILKNLKKLRVVHVDIEGYMAAIPACICELKHLRFLRIHNPLSMKVHLPKSLGTIYHLQILELRGSGVLEFSNVKKMSHLTSLRSIRYSGFSFDNSDVSGFPGLGELRSLRELSDFRVRKEKGYELQQLKGINNLSGNLRISGLDCVESKEIALEAKLTEKTHLTALSLEWSPCSRQQHSLSRELQVEILEGLCPPSQLTELHIWRYGGWKCPSWLSQDQNGLISRLQHLELCQCYNLEALPEMGDLLLCLSHLKLVSLPKLRKLPEALPKSLKSLEIQRCGALVITCEEDVNMIRKHFIERASQIEPSLNTPVHPEEIDMFADEQPDRFTTILCDIFGRCGSLPARLIRGHITEEDYSRFMLPASLNRIIISYCAITDTVLHNSLRGSTSLDSLNLKGLPFLTSIPYEVMRCLPKICDLSIDECVRFTQLQGLNHLTRLQHLSVTKCPNLGTLEDKVCVLHGVAVDDISLVPQLLSREGCSSLWSLRIDESEILREEEILQQFHSLTSLNFSCCSWNRLPENLATLTSLEHLHLDYCRNIRSLPTLSASLHSFELTDCDPSFMKSCQKAGDPNWQKIAHIPVKRFFP